MHGFGWGCCDYGRSFGRLVGSLRRCDLSQVAELQCDCGGVQGGKVGIRVDSKDPSNGCNVCRADAVVRDVDLRVVKVGIHSWEVFELVLDTESGTDSEVMFGSIFHDGSRG